MMADDNLRQVYIRNLSEKTNEELIYELFLQAGPVEDVTLPRNPNGRPKTFGFVKFKHECSVTYAKELFKHTELFGKELLIESKRDEEANGVYGSNSLRGFGGDAAIRGRYDLYSRSTKGHDLLPPTKPRFLDRNEPVSGVANFDTLLKMGTQLQSPIDFTSLTSPYNVGSPSMYPSQTLDPIMNTHGERSNNQNRHDRSYNHRDNNRDRDRYQNLHPYRDNRHDDRKYGGYHSRNHSSSSHRRERK